MTSPWVEDAERLAIVWSVLGQLIAAAPDGASLTRVRSAELLADWPLLGGPRTAEGLALLAASATQEESLEDVADDHFHLFVGPGAVLAPPWESVHLSEDHLLFDNETLEVREFYARFGLQAPSLNREPDDHIGLELEFLATLLTRAVDHDARGETEQAEAHRTAHTEFLTEHLLKWAPDFFTLVETKAATSFYRAVGVLGLDACAQVQRGLRPGQTESD